MSRFAHLRVILGTVKPQTEREWRDMFGIDSGVLGSWNDGSDFSGFWDDDEYEYVDLETDEEDDTDDGPTVYGSSARSWVTKRRRKEIACG